MENSNRDTDIIRSILKQKKLDGKQEENEYRLQIYDEIRKGEDMDTDLIDEDLRLLYMIADQEYDDQVDVKEGISKAKKRADSARPAFKRFLDLRLSRLAMAFCGFVVLIVVANSFLVQATGNGINDYVVEFGRNYIGFNFMKSDSKATQSGSAVTNDGLYNTMHQECEQYGLAPLLPADLPDDFKQINFEKNETSVDKSVNIVVGNKKDSIVIDVGYYQDTKYLPQFKSPDATDLTTLKVNGIDVYLVRQGNKNTASFYNDHYVYTLSSSLGRDETEDILKSFK